MGRVTITFYPNDRKQSKTTKQIPIYLRIRKERLKTEARTDWSVSPNERATLEQNHATRMILKIVKLTII